MVTKTRRKPTITPTPKNSRATAKGAREREARRILVRKQLKRLEVLRRRMKPAKVPSEEVLREVRDGGKAVKRRTTAPEPIATVYAATIEQDVRGRRFLRFPDEIVKLNQLRAGQPLIVTRLANRTFLIRVLPRWTLSRRHEGWLEAFCEHGVGHSLGIHGCDLCCKMDNYPRQTLLDDEKTNPPAPPRKPRSG